MDESAFDNRSKSSHGWAKRGQQLYGEVQGKREVRENLIACRYGQELIAPMIVKGSINAQCFEEWMKQHLFKELPKGCTIIMDNAPIHRKSVIMDLATASGYTVIFLPKYSPDFNKIEHDFAALKKRRTYAPIGTSLDSVVADYANRKNL